MPTMSTEQVITVTWTDGQGQMYDHVVGHRVADGVLTIDQVIPRLTPKTLHLPLANIRVWEVAERPTWAAP